MTYLMKFVRLLSLGLLSLLAACGGDDDGFPTGSCGGPDNPCPAHVVALQVLPDPNVMAVATTAQYQAIATLSDGSHRDVTASVTWSLDMPEVASVDSAGMVKARASGTALVSASYLEAVPNAKPVTDSARLTVTDAALLSLSVQPPQAQILVGMTQAYQAVAHFDDGHIQDVTADASWSVSEGLIADISLNNRQANAVGKQAGITSVNAGFAGASAQASLVVLDAAVAGLKISPIDASLPKGTGLAYQAMLALENGDVIDVTRVSSWQTDSSAIATVDTAGYLTAQAQGTTRISATLSYGANQLTDATHVTVTDAALTQLTVSPVNASFPAGTQETFIATAYFSDGSTADVTRQSAWQSSAQDIATIVPVGESAGDAVAIAPGESQITAAYQGMQAATKVTVTNAVLESITISPLDAQTPVGTGLRYQASAVYSDASVKDITRLGFWQSSQPDISVIGANGALAGIALGREMGATQISISYQGRSATTSLTVTDAVLTGLQITPRDLVKPIGTQGQYQATAYFSDGSSLEVTQDALWQSAQPDIVAIVTSGVDAGMARALATGSTQIQASYGGLKAISAPSTRMASTLAAGAKVQAAGASDQTGAQVTDAQLTGLTLLPGSATIAAGYQQAYRLYASFTDGNTREVTSQAFWQVGDVNIAHIDRQGIALGLSAGQTQVHASYLGSRASAELTVTDALLTELQVIPAVTVLPEGYQTQLSALGRYSDGQVKDVTALAVWRSDTPTVAQIAASGSQAGWVTALSAGNAVMTADFDGMQAQGEVQVTSAILESVSLSPVLSTVAAGNIQSYEFSGLFSDGSVRDLTGVAGWQSSDVTVASINRFGVAQSHKRGVANILASYQGFQAAAKLHVTSAELTMLQISPPNITVPAGTQGQYQATAFYSDGHASDVTAQASWGSVDDGIAVIVPVGVQAGEAQALTPGSTQITAAFEGKTAIAALKVTDAVLISLEVSPARSEIPVGLEQAYQAHGIFSDGSRRDLTAQCSWLAEDPLVATVGRDGLATGMVVGQTRIIADYAGIRGDALLSVMAAVPKTLQLTPLEASVPVGTQGQFEARVFLTDGSSQNVNTLAAWRSSADTLVHVANGSDGGLATALAVGEAQVTVTYQGLSQTAQVQVSAAVLEELSIAPLNAKVAAGLTLQYHAYGRFSDGSSRELTPWVNWLSEHDDIASLDRSGLAHTYQSGVTNVTAHYIGFSASTPLTVGEPALVKLEISPDIARVAINAETQYQARGFFSDGFNQDVTSAATWSVLDTSIASIENGRFREGIATGLAAGSTGIQASYDGMQAQARIDVIDKVYLGLLVEPANSSVIKGLSQQYTAQAVYDDGSREWVTDLALWEVTRPEIASIEQGGLLTGQQVGVSGVFAHYQGGVGEAQVQVVDDTPTSFKVTPADLLGSPGTRGRYKAEASFSGVKLDVTEFSTWSSSDSQTVQVIAAGKDAGMAHARKPGTAQISAQFRGMTDSVTTRVEPLQLTGFSVEPKELGIPLADGGQLRAYAHYHNGSRQEVTLDSVWSSDNPGLWVESGNSSAGWVTGAHEDLQGLITATYQGMSDSATVYVLPPQVIEIRVTPSVVTVAVGKFVEVQATVVFDNGTEQDYTKYVHYTPANEDLVFANKGIIEGRAVGSTQVEVEFEGVTSQIAVTVTP
ncbi:Ig-like domain-containing protein [Shewanella sp. GXUN23E]|uniref:Ig-like domain-containing protein n=1 Tax=Shewanella sp. GXUN23E TaxID=3422498 RepID=UPI003D7C99B5